ncbi:TetR/AcrR family transcriptional regulator C-terminal ligand-binding domain-containing protein [Streptomyces sp. NPDC005908]|uniref:TetR/AcrR family transcriptional regulator C-terminal ligand-binding domain-containing protein n=1 Tax=Streptomyces sp. NPDC005908 TaxID=3157084 RepID=UPI0033DFFAAA
MCWPDERASAAQADPADPHGTGRPAVPRLRRHTGLGGDLAALNSEVQAGLTGEPVTAALITASFRSPEAASALQRFRGDRYARCAVVVERGVAGGRVPCGDVREKGARRLHGTGRSASPPHAGRRSPPRATGGTGQGAGRGGRGLRRRAAGVAHSTPTKTVSFPPGG